MNEWVEMKKKNFISFPSPRLASSLAMTISVWCCLPFTLACLLAVANKTAQKPKRMNPLSKKLFPSATAKWKRWIQAMQKVVDYYGENIFCLCARAVQDSMNVDFSSFLLLAPQTQKSWLNRPTPTLSKRDRTRTNKKTLVFSIKSCCAKWRKRRKGGQIGSVLVLIEHIFIYDPLWTLIMDPGIICSLGTGLLCHFVILCLRSFAVFFWLLLLLLLLMITIESTVVALRKQAFKHISLAPQSIRRRRRRKSWLHLEQSFWWRNTVPFQSASERVWLYSKFLEKERASEGQGELVFPLAWRETKLTFSITIDSIYFPSAATTTTAKTKRKEWRARQPSQVDEGEGDERGKNGNPVWPPLFFLCALLEFDRFLCVRFVLFIAWPGLAEDGGWLFQF